MRGRLLPALVRYREIRFPTFPVVDTAIAASDDYFRYTTLSLALRRVLQEEIPGVIAEVGVWHGETSAFPCREAPQSRLYLFDTLERFPGQDLPPGAVDEQLRDTRVPVSHWMTSCNVILMPGYVPATPECVADETFSVGLLDLFDATLGSVEFFYPRLSPGAYPVMHDYNNEQSDWACNRALDVFLVDKLKTRAECGDL